MKNKKKAPPIFILPVILAFLGVASCGFDDLPEDFNTDLTLDSNQSSYSSATGTVTLDFIEDEIHLTLSEIPDADTDCMYMGYATTASGTTALGAFTLSDEEEEGEEHEHAELKFHSEDHDDVDADDHDANADAHEDEMEDDMEHDAEATETSSGESEEEGHSEDEGEAEHGHMNGELEIHASDLDLNMHEMTAIEVIYECTGETESETTIFSADLTSGESSSSEDSAEEGGHTH